MNWLMSESASAHGPTIDALYYTILAITGLVFVAVQVTLVYLIIRYRHRDGQKAAYVPGNVRVEVVWTAIPFLIMLFLAFQSRNVWRQVRYQDRMPENALEIAVQARQFEWLATYPGPDGQLGTADDIESRNRIPIPVNRPVLVRLTAAEVIHSFFIPDFRVKQDAVPGMEIPVWFEATRTGEFPLACAELCGLGHYRMGGTVVVQTPEEFETWQRQAAAAQ